MMIHLLLNSVSGLGVSGKPRPEAVIQVDKVKYGRYVHVQRIVKVITY